MPGFSEPIGMPGAFLSLDADACNYHPAQLGTAPRTTGSATKQLALFILLNSHSMLIACLASSSVNQS